MLGTYFDPQKLEVYKSRNVLNSTGKKKGTTQGAPLGLIRKYPQSGLEEELLLMDKILHHQG